MMSKQWPRGQTQRAEAPVPAAASAQLSAQGSKGINRGSCGHRWPWSRPSAASGSLEHTPASPVLPHDAGAGPGSPRHHPHPTTGAAGGAEPVPLQDGAAPARAPRSPARPACAHRRHQNHNLPVFPAGLVQTPNPEGGTGARAVPEPRAGAACGLCHTAVCAAGPMCPVMVSLSLPARGAPGSFQEWGTGGRREGEVGGHSLSPAESHSRATALSPAVTLPGTPQHRGSGTARGPGPAPTPGSAPAAGE